MTQQRVHLQVSPSRTSSSGQILRAAVIMAHNGLQSLRRTCDSTYQVLNSKSVQIGGRSWLDSTDHSKWAVTHDGTILCVGDINRQSGQFARGGGTVCIKDSKLGFQLKGAVQSGQNCDGTVAHVAHNLRNRHVLE